ncbi:MAG: 2-dehydropantoate 2-reductase, partial [Chloroflexi bacterium]|nr:2-dehydropantoate 2-reductase [Chloroflexota bacterium]
MKIAVMGAGGVGGYFGGLLARAGEDVTYIARGEHLRAIKERGLRVVSELSGEFVAGNEATDNPGDVGPVDLVLYTVKMYHNDDAIPLIAPLVGDGTVV